MRRFLGLAAALVSAVAIGISGSAPTAVAAPTPLRITPPPLVYTPMDLSASHSSASIFLSWTHPDYANRPSSFRVYEGSTVVARNTSTFATVPNLGWGTTHTFTVTAVDAFGNESGHSAPITHMIYTPGQPPQCIPGRPTGLVAAIVTASYVSLSWNPAEDFPSVVISGAGQRFFTRLSTAQIGGLAPDTTYTFTVGQSRCPESFASSVTVTTMSGPAARADAPTGLTSIGSTNESVTLSWTPPAGGVSPARYAIYEGRFQRASTTATSVTLTRLWRSTTHAYTVTALTDTHDESVHSPQSAADTLPCDDQPPAPIAVTATVVSASSVALGWISETEASSFTVYDGSAPVATTKVPSTMVTGLRSRSSHQFRVVANLPSPCGVTPASATVAAQTRSGPKQRPTAPVDLRQVSAKPGPPPGLTGTVTVAWNQPASRDRVRRYRVYEGARVLATTAGRTFTLELAAATEHVISVTAVDSAGNESRQSAPLRIVVPYIVPQ